MANHRDRPPKWPIAVAAISFWTMAGMISQHLDTRGAVHPNNIHDAELGNLDALKSTLKVRSAEVVELEERIRLASMRDDMLNKIAVALAVAIAVSFACFCACAIFGNMRSQAGQTINPP